MFIVVPETSLQTNSGVDMDLLMEGYKVGVEINGGTFTIFSLVHTSKTFCVHRKRA